ncbi:MAG TPA: hypothetical protein VFJ14_08600, partial [Nocardioidaceae bacterium]|nr:hypothetical protein [Nocardioidaceae bacterium]
PDAPSTPSGTEAAEPLPRSRPAVLALLAAAEEDAAAAHRADVRRAESGRFAQLLASISAAETQHATTIEGTLEEAVR